MLKKDIYIKGKRDDGTKNSCKKKKKQKTFLKAK